MLDDDMGILDKLFKRTNNDAPPLWSGRPSIYAHVQAHLGPGDAGLDAAGQTLPDEPEATAGALRWAAGAIDGVMSHHMGGEKEVAERVSKLAQAVYRAAHDPDGESELASLYVLMKEGQALGVVDALDEKIQTERAISPKALHALARRLVLLAADREPLKLAIALLGLVADGRDEELLLTIGAHEEFTLFAMVALLRSQPDPVASLWRLMRRVRGWGRIHIIERLAQLDDLPDELRDYLLREGYRNDVMYDYTALPCAQGGKLLAALQREHVDDHLLDGAGHILQALLAPSGAAAAMDDYEDGAQALRAYLGHVERRTMLRWDFCVIASLRDWLMEDEANWEERAARGFSADWRKEMQARCVAFLERPQWPQLARQGLHSADAQTFTLADRVARILGIDTWEHQFARLCGGNRFHYFAVMQDRNPDRIERVLRHAERDLDLDEIAKGPELQLGFGPGFEQHSALDCILQNLGAMPGRGWPFIRSGLRSPVIRNRNLAVAALATWNRDAWPEDALPLLQKALAEEPDESVRGRMHALLKGESA
jgi:hypothetical protein